MKTALARVAWVIVGLTCWPLTPLTLYSQEVEAGPDATSVEAGTRVRVTAPFVLSDRIEGSVTQVADGTLQVSTSGGLVDVPLANLQKLEVSLGEKANAGRGALYGTAIGGLAGLALGLIEGGTECAPGAFLCTETSAGQVAGMGLLTGAALGAGVGAIVGALVKTEKWETVPVSALSLGPGLGGGWQVAMSVSLR